MNRKTNFSVLIVAAGIGLSSAAAWADLSPRDNPARTDNGQARLTMAQAVTIAEVRLNGRVVKAKLDEGSAPAVFKFDLVDAGNQRQQARVAAVGGQLLPVPQDGQHRSH